MQRFFKVILPFIGALFIVLNFSSCNKKEKSSKGSDFVNYISYHTSGVISKNATIKIRLVTSEKEVKVGEEAPDLLSFKPSTKKSV